jgi:hypothetical protein
MLAESQCLGIEPIPESVVITNLNYVIAKYSHIAAFAQNTGW